MTGCASSADLPKRRPHQGEFDPLQPAVLLAWAAPELVAAALRRDLARAYEGLQTPITSAARLAELERLDKRILAVEAEIAAAWWLAVNAGMTLETPDIPGAALIGLGAA